MVDFTITKKHVAVNNIEALKIIYNKSRRQDANYTDCRKNQFKSGYGYVCYPNLFLNIQVPGVRELFIYYIYDIRR